MFGTGLIGGRIEADRGIRETERGDGMKEGKEKMSEKDKQRLIEVLKIFRNTVDPKKNICEIKSDLLVKECNYLLSVIKDIM